jgi:hypothetical protein
MRSLQDCINIYRGIANNLHLTGDSVELLIQLLANSTYINEIEHINYANESSLERATLLNSKIQQCVNIMYSVFRGTCPRVIIRFKSKRYFELNLFDEISSSNNFKLYYIGYHKDNKSNSTETSSQSDVEGTQSIKKEGEQFDDFIYAPTVIPPTGDAYEYKILCLLSKNLITNTQKLTDSNRYYVDIPENNLSNDLWVTVNGDMYDVYRKFDDHIKNGGLFDLTLPSFGMRLYSPDIFRENKSEIDVLNSDISLPPSNTEIKTNVFEYCKLSEFNDSELSKIKVKGAELDKEFSYLPDGTREHPEETYPGLTIIDSSDRDTVESIHYKANRDRYSNSIIRSNYDVGVMLEEYFPGKVIKGGTYYKFEKNGDNEGYKPSITIYYIPYSSMMLISQSEIEQFKENRMSYYVTDDIVIKTGNKKNIIFTVNVELYDNNKIDNSIKDILKEYENIFNIDLKSKIPEIESSISKISNVKSILNVIEDKVVDGETIKVITPGISFKQVELDGTYTEYTPEEDSYCSIDYVINSTLYIR